MTLLEIFAKELDNIPNILNQKPLKTMKNADQLSTEVICNQLSAGQFRDLLKSLEIPFYEGWKKKDYIFYLIDEPKTIFEFSDVDGYLYGVLTYLK
jgi:hypothetical protein